MAGIGHLLEPVATVSDPAAGTWDDWGTQLAGVVVAWISSSDFRRRECNSSLILRKPSIVLALGEQLLLT